MAPFPSLAGLLWLPSSGISTSQNLVGYTGAWIHYKIIGQCVFIASDPAENQNAGIEGRLEIRRPLPIIKSAAVLAAPLRVALGEFRKSLSETHDKIVTCVYTRGREIGKSQ